MTLKTRLFTKDARKASSDLAANLQYIINKTSRDKPVKLSALKVDYDRFFKDKISSKTPEAVSAALKTIEEHVIVVKVYAQEGNREMTDSLVGLRSASYAAEMCNEDSPQLSKERLLQIIRDEASNGIYVRDVEERYISVYGNRPSYLPYKSLKGLLHRTPDVELASSGKNLRVRIRQNALVTPQSAALQRRPTLSQIPTLNRSSLVMSQPLKSRRPRDIMSMSMFRPSAKNSRSEMRSEMTRSVFIPSSSSSSESSSPSISSSGSPSGSVDMSMSMIMTPSISMNDTAGRSEQKSFKQISDKDDMSKHNKDIMAAILNGLPPEGLPLRRLIDEFVAISGQTIPMNMTAVDFLKKEFKEIVKIADDPEGLRVYRINSPLCPRRTLADVYTRIALHSNRKPSDRVLKVLKDIYKNRESSTTTEDPVTSAVLVPAALSHRSIGQDTEKPIQQDTGKPSRGPEKLSFVEKQPQTTTPTDEQDEVIPRPRPRLNSKSQRDREHIVADLKARMAKSPIKYPEEFERIVDGNVADNQSLLMDLMSSLNLCLKPSGGRLVLTMN